MGSAAIPILAASTTTLLLYIALLSHHSSHPFTPAHADESPSSVNNDSTSTNSNLVTSFDQFPFDENNHLSSHILAYPNTEPCKSFIESQLAQQTELYLHLPLAVDGDVASALFPDSPGSSSTDADADTPGSIQECPLVCLDRGIDAHLLPYPMPQKYYSPKSNDEHRSDISSSLSTFLGSHSCGKVEIAVINYTPSTLDFYWVNPTGEEVYLYPLERKEFNTKFIHTFLTHRFRAKNPENGEIVFDQVVEFAGTFGIGNHVNPHRERDIRQQVKNTMDGEWRKKQMVKRTFSKLGFDKGRLPNDLYGSMRSFYYNNR
jgi:hypothetical protein